MEQLCMLVADINNCQYYNIESGTCNNGPEICGFNEKPSMENQTECQWKPKWFEQYMRYKGKI